MVGGRGFKREHGAKRGAVEKGGSGRGTAGGRGAKGGSDDEASDAENIINYTRPPPHAAEIENYSVLNLDTPETSHDSWRATVLRFRAWCFINTNERYRFGHKQRQSCMMPEAGHFLVYVHRHGKWMCLVIDGPTGYLTGYITRSSTKDKKIQENRAKIGKGERKEMKSKLPMYIECAKMLPWKGSYLYAEECLLGDLGLQKSFTIMYNHLEGSQIYELAEVQEAGETFIIHLPEAGRSNVLYHKIDNDFINGQSKLGSLLLSDSRTWRDRTKKAFLRMVDSSPDKWALKKQAKSIGHQPESVEEKVFGIGAEEVLPIIEDIRVYYRKVKKSRIFSLQDLPVQLGSQGPVNNKLNNLLKFGAQDLPDSMFLVEPFLKFKRTQNTNQASTESKASKNMDKKLGPSLHSQGCNSVPKANVTKVEEKLRVGLGLKSHSDECKVSAKVVSQQQQQAEQNHAGVGLKNLGNTCFANSALQLLHSIPDLMSGLKRFSNDMNNPMADQASRNLTEAMYEVFLQLDHSLEVVSPDKFLKSLEEKYAMYEERVGKLHKQQDAGECLLYLMETLSQTLRTEESANLVKRLFGVDLLSSNENGEEVQIVPIDHLNCVMPGGDVNGLLKGLEIALRAQNSSINKLPRYLTIILERVKFDGQIRQAVKDPSKLDYPLEFDASSLCSNELKHVLEANRKATMTNGEDSVNMDIDEADLSIQKDQLTGLYDLVALIAHEGPNVNSGHYIALVKQDEDQWIQFDDGSKTILNNEGVLKLTGGGDGQMACVCLYKARVVREGSL